MKREAFLQSHGRRHRARHHFIGFHPAGEEKLPQAQAGAGHARDAPWDRRRSHGRFISPQTSPFTRDVILL
jgi:hypothetical protein